MFFDMKNLMFGKKRLNSRMVFIVSLASFPKTIDLDLRVNCGDARFLYLRTLLREVAERQTRIPDDLAESHGSPMESVSP